MNEICVLRMLCKEVPVCSCCVMETCLHFRWSLARPSFAFQTVHNAAFPQTLARYGDIHGPFGGPCRLCPLGLATTIITTVIMILIISSYAIAPGDQPASRSCIIPATLPTKSISSSSGTPA